MTYFILRGWHYAIPLFTWIYRRKKVFTRVVSFDKSCLYDLNNDDQGDMNKLFGFAYTSSAYRPADVKWWQLWKYQHGESARFGWRPVNGMIELSAYCHVNRKRVIIPIASIPVKTEYATQISIENGNYVFRVYKEGYRIGRCAVAFTHGYEWQALLGPYCGGNRTAIQRMKLKLRRL